MQDIHTENHVMENTIEKTENKYVATNLSYHPDWNVQQQDKYVYQYHFNKLQPLLENQISITGLKLIELENEFIISAFIRSTLPKAIRFDNISLILLNKKGEAVAKKRFDMHLFGELPKLTCRPWRFMFSKEDILNEQELPKADWKIVFEIVQKQKKHQIEFADSWEKALTQEQKEKYQSLVTNLPPLKQNEVNIMGIDIQFTSNESVQATVLIRNGSNKDITLEQFPAEILDATGETVAKGGFKLTDFVVRANTSKPWSFIFPPELVLKKNADFSKWTIRKA